MKSFRLTLVFIYLLTSIASFNLQAAEILCSGISMTPTKARYIKLGAGETVWGNYTCKNCGNRNSARPDSQGRQVCKTCSAPPAVDQFEPPGTITSSDGRDIYLIDPTDLISDSDVKGKKQAASLGWDCPYCGAANIDTKNCNGCGAQLDIPEAKPFHADYTNSSHSADPFAAAPRSEVPGFNLKKSSDSSQSGIKLEKNKTSSQQMVSDFKQADIKGKLIIAGSVIAVIGIAGIVWGSLSYHEEGEIQEIRGDSVLINYRHNDVDHQIEIKAKTVMAPEDQRIPFKYGEKVQIYFTNFSGAKGAERLDGDAYPVLVLKDR